MQVLRAATYNCSKIGLYDVFKRILAPEGGGSLGFGSQLLAGLASGAIGAAVSNPCDLILVSPYFSACLQCHPVPFVALESFSRCTLSWHTGNCSQFPVCHLPPSLTMTTLALLAALTASLSQVRMLGDAARPAHEQRRYGNAVRVLFSLNLSEVMIGFWPNVARATVTTACQLVSYDRGKQALARHSPLGDGVACHISASVFAGVVAGVVSNPMDVVKTRLMNALPGTYRPGVGGVAMCLLSAVRNEGVTSLYKGCGVTILRQSTFTTFTFVAMEQIRAALAPFAK